MLNPRRGRQPQSWDPAEQWQVTSAVTVHCDPTGIAVAFCLCTKQNTQGQRGASAECEAVGWGLSRSQRPLSSLTISQSTHGVFVTEGVLRYLFQFNCCSGEWPLPRLLTGNKHLFSLEPSSQITNTTASGDGSCLGYKHATSCLSSHGGQRV